MNAKLEEQIKETMKEIAKKSLIGKYAALDYHGQLMNIFDTKQKAQKFLDSCDMDGIVKLIEE